MDVQAVLHSWELPSRGDTSHSRTDGFCHPGQCLHCLLEVRLLLLHSWGPQQCWRDEEDEGGTKQSPRDGKWLLGESGGLAGSLPRHRAAGSEIAGRMNVRRHEHMTMGKCQIKLWGIAWKSVQGKAAGEARSISDSVLTEESGLSHRTMQSPAFCIFFFWVTQNVDSFA